MNESSNYSKLERRLRIFAAFIVLGLLLEMLSLAWIHPLAFLLFAFLGCGLLFIGMAGYLYSVVSIPIETGESLK